MLRVVEAFSGIGSQAKALERIGIDFEIVNTIEWDLNAIYAYDLIHNGRQNLEKYNELSKDDLVSILGKFSLSGDGKKPIKENGLRVMSIEGLKRILCAIERSKDLIRR